ncbi:MAG: SDR family NAD(P)-dependent oxidoreductase [Gemmatimonadaceae bacterium]|nr:SDR family NAD(P)-dependent oxidoreductase [Gemmatimonadaceae bacterium]
MSDISGTTVLVTGGASGIGLLTGQRLLAAGAAHLVIWDIDGQALDAVVSRMRDAGHTIDGLKIDITDLAEVREAARLMAHRGIAVDILVNNAGIIVGRDFASHSHDDIDRTMAINTTAPMHLTAELLPGMIARGRGHVVNIASAAGMIANPGMSVYCASKWAMTGWSDSLRLEMERGRTGVQVTTVMPYYIDTGMFAGVRSRLIPLLKPGHVASAIVDAIRDDRVVLRLPKLLDLLPFVRGILPARVFDKVAGDWFGVYDSMRTFTGRPR